MSRTATQPPGIFICYRRDDSAGYALYLFERLSAHFGDGQIFMDLEQIEPGEDFVQVIENAVGSCEILLALIGRSWLASRDEAGRRLDNPADFVRLEIAAALARGVGVIPVLVQGAQVPQPQELPEDIRPLTRRQAFELGHRGWRHDVNQLVDRLERVLARRQEERLRAEQEEEARRREAEAQRRAEEAERLERAKAEAERQAREAADAERRQAEAQEVERLDAAEYMQMTVADLLRSSRTEAVSPSAATGGWRAAQARRLTPARIVAGVVVQLIVITLIWLLSGTGSDTYSGGVIGMGDEPPPPTVSALQPPLGMVYVPGGEFQMGSDAGDEYERPAHTVTVKPFFIDQYEVTNEEYAKFVQETGHSTPRTWKKGEYPAREARRPVTGVSWNDAFAYAKWWNKRLPTEEEWEFAVRGADGRRYPWGREWRAGLANAGGASNGMADVGSYPAGRSPFGALDMVGNAWEWTATDLAPYPNGKLPIRVTGNLKVIRGGSFAEDRTQATATYRGHLDANSPNNDKTGFRCAKDAPAAQDQ